MTRSGSSVRVTPLTVTDILLEHMAAVARMAWEQAPEVMVLEDVMRTTSLEQLQTYGLGELVEPVIWSYGSLLAFPPVAFTRLSGAGANSVWGGSNMHVTTVRHHVDNNSYT